MADNQKDKPADDLADFDFSGPAWDSPEDETPNVAPVATSDDEDPFGAGAFGDDDPFGSSAPASAKGPAEAFEIDGDIFNQTNDDPFASAGSDNPFEIHDMPIPGATSLGSADEFDDLSADVVSSNFAKDDGYDDANELFVDDEHAPAAPVAHVDPFEQNDDVADDQYEPTETHVTGSDPFNEDEDDASAEGQAPVAANSNKRKFVMPIAAAAVVALVGYVGYTTVLPTFFGGGPAPVETANIPVNVPSFPAALPGQDGGLSLPDVTGQKEDVLSPPPVTGIPPLVEATRQPIDTALLPSTPVVAAPLPVLPDASGPAGTTVGIPSFDEIAGGEDRGGIAAMNKPAPEVVSAAPIAPSELDDVISRISALEAKFDNLIARFESSSSRPQASAPSFESAPEQSTVTLTTVDDLASLEPPLKPEIIESATLKGVSRDVAWVSTNSGVVEVKAGDSIPNAGKVLKIREYQGSWIVVTTNGIVVQ